MESVQSGERPARAEGGTFLPGNPGRPKGIIDKRQDAGRKAAQALAAKAWSVIHDLLASDDERIQLDASKLVLEYAHGKPRQSISVEDLRESVEESARARGLDPMEVLNLARELAQRDTAPS